jgi:hypothetical protein
MASDAQGVISCAGFKTEKNDWELTKTAAIRLKSVTKSLDIIFLKKLECVLRLCDEKVFSRFENQIMSL